MKKNEVKDTQKEHEQKTNQASNNETPLFHKVTQSPALQNVRDLQNLVKLINQAEMTEEDGDEPAADIIQKIFTAVAEKEISESVFLGLLSKCYISSHEVHITVKDKMTHFKPSAAIPDAFIRAREYFRSHRDQSTLAIMVYSDHLEVLSSNGKATRVSFE
jgi:hypothetical protein